MFIDGQDVTTVSYTEALRVRQKLGMVFQSAALFDSMTVFENVAYPLREHVKMREADIEKRVHEVLEFVDLDPEQVKLLLSRARPEESFEDLFDRLRQPASEPD